MERKKREGVVDDFCLFEVQNKVIGVPHLADAHIVADVHVATKGGRMRPKIKTNLQQIMTNQENVICLNL